MKLRDFIVRTHLGNTDENQHTGNSAFDTEDYVFFETYDEVNNIDADELYVYASDYAVMNGAALGGEERGPKYRQPTWHWMRSAYSPSHVVSVAYGGTIYVDDANTESAGLCPAMHLNLSSVISALGAPEHFKIEPFKDKSGKILYHTIEFGSYPQDKAKNSSELESLFNAHKLTPTGKTYIGYMKEDGSFQQNQEFEYGGKKYVRVISKKYDDDSEYKDKTKAPENGTPMWAEVGPIKWKIKNWDELPRSINPNGKGTAKTIYVKSEEGIMSGIPFYPEYGETEDTMWQNSPLRAILNGYDLQEELNKGNGNNKYKTNENYNFKGRGFLEEAFEETLKGERIMEKDMRPRTRLEKLNPDTTPVRERRKMTNAERICDWIRNRESVLLRGPSGIGKTSIVRAEFENNLIYIKMYNNMFPEKLMGSMNLQTGMENPPAYALWAIQHYSTKEEWDTVLVDVDEGKKAIDIDKLCDLADIVYERTKHEKEPLVILLDELLNVKPDIQALAYTLVLNKMIEMGRGIKLPANTVIVATGNPAKYSIVGKDMPEPLQKRFMHVLDMEPKVGQWLEEYAIPHKLHPTVIGYILSKYQQSGKNENIDRMPYFYEGPDVAEDNATNDGEPVMTNDPRNWEEVSQMLYNFEEKLQKGKYAGYNVESVLRYSLGSRLRQEWAAEFFDFYNSPALTVEEVVAKKYSEIDLPNNVNSKYKVMASLLVADVEQVEECRKFILEYCGAEFLAAYDLYWVGTDDERAKKIAELRGEKIVIEERHIKPRENYSTHENYQLTLEDFTKTDDKKHYAIHCKTQKEANFVKKILKKINFTTNASQVYSNGEECIYQSRGDTLTSIQKNSQNITVVEFEGVNMSKHLSADEMDEWQELLYNALENDPYGQQQSE